MGEHKLAVCPGVVVLGIRQQGARDEGEFGEDRRGRDGRREMGQKQKSMVPGRVKAIVLSVRMGWTGRATTEIGCDGPDLVRLHVVLGELVHQLELIRQRLAQLQKRLEPVLPKTQVKGENSQQRRDGSTGSRGGPVGPAVELTKRCSGPG